MHNMTVGLFVVNHHTGPLNVTLGLSVDQSWGETFQDCASTTIEITRRMNGLSSFGLGIATKNCVKTRPGFVRRR